MELLKNIFFNTDKLVQNTTVKISYTGKFFFFFSEETHIHYGFGENWEGLSDVPMEKTDLGFQCEIELLGNYSTLNLCFKNENGEWDNNDNTNYIFDIEKKQNELLVLEDEPVALGSVRKLRKSYLWSKKIRLAVYKIITYFPKILSGNYKRKISEN